MSGEQDLQDISAPSGLHDISAPSSLLEAGKALQKVGTAFVTAIAVQKPRDMGRIVKALERECEYGGESFYYSMSFKGQRVEGGSIGLAQSVAREWGNCAVTCAVEETSDAWLFTPRFIDLERGVQIERVYRQRKAGQVHGKFDEDRKLDIAFQIGQSKALRNVIFSGVPRWLVDKCLEDAKSAVIAKITPGGLEKAAQQAIAAFAKFKVSPEALVEKVGSPVAEWTSRDIAALRGDFKAIQTGEMGVADLFPGASPEGIQRPQRRSSPVVEEPKL